jgi:putative flavoprotein involved in K+ transport
VIIGGGQAGLALSYCLSALGIDHVVMERGELAQRWRTQSWDSLRLLTPNWMTRLPGFHYDGDEPDGFMSARELVAMFERYAASFRPPLLTHTTVNSVQMRNGRFSVASTAGTWLADSVVIATGSCDVPFVPDVSRELPGSITQIVPADYRRPEQLPPGGVLVVGASATGVQLADEIQRSGRQVTLAVGRHTRLPRRYRGRDILWWLDRTGVLNRAVDPESASHRRPSFQLVGTPEHASLDLASLHETGVRLAGRVQQIDGTRVRLDGDLAATASAADARMSDMLRRIDEHIATMGFAAPQPETFTPTWPLASAAPDTLDLKDDGIHTVVWATGYRRRYPWLHVPVVNTARGDIAHIEGETRVPGLYVLGFNFQRRLNSGFIDGVGADARVIANRIAASIPGVRVA